MAKLVVVSQGMAGLSHELGAGWTTIGRADGNMFQIVETSVSGRHCEVQLRGEELLIRDLRSTNGTFIGNQKVTESSVKVGQLFRLGQVELRVEASASAPAAAPGVPFVNKMLVTPATRTEPAQSPSVSIPSVNIPGSEKKVSSPAPTATTLPAKTESKSDKAAEPLKKHQVLFVDDSMAFLETFGELCAEYSGRTWEIHTASTVDRALAVLQQFPVDLVVLDIGMPMVDGIQLLGIVNRRYPGIKAAVMTGNATEANRAACLAGGAELFIEKPVSADGIKSVFNMLNDLISWTYRDGFSGTLRQVGLQEVIQMECLGRHSSILEVRHQSVRGQIYIEAGTIIHVVFGSLAGEKALHQLLELEGGQFQLQPFKAPSERTVQGSWEFLLMEAARLHDEDKAQPAKSSPSFAAQSSSSPPIAVTPPAAIHAPAEPAKPAAPPAQEAGGQLQVMGDDIVVVATYDGKWHPIDGSKDGSKK